MLPLPSYYCEKRVLMGTISKLDLRAYLCHHDNLIINYYDIYPGKKYKKLLYNAERKLIESKKSLKPERDLLCENSTMFNKILIGTTMLPEVLVDYLLDHVGFRLKIE